MEVKNARIKNVTIGLDDRDRLSASMAFEGQIGGCAWGFILTNPIDSERLVKLMDYAGVSDVLQLNGKIIRVVYHNCFLRGFGDPIEDRFVPVFGEELKQISVEQFAAMFQNQ